MERMLTIWIRYVTGAFVAPLLTIGCSTAQNSSETLQVVATTSIIGDIVDAIGGEAIHLLVLLPRGTDPHSFEPSPRDLVSLSDADIVFINGAGLEEFIESLLKAAQAESSVVDLSTGIGIRSGGEEAITYHLHPSHGPREKSSVDPHIWLNPLNVVQWTETIEDALVASDTDNAERYSSRADSVRTLLRTMDAWIQEELNVIPRERRLLVSDHAAFGYFADRYDFRQVGAIYPGFSTLSEPSARELSELEDTMKVLGVSAIFVGTTVNPRLAEHIADDIGIRIVRLYVGSLSTADGPAPSYLAMMRYNVRALVAALREE